MNSRELKLYFKELKEVFPVDISDHLLEKDYRLSLLLSTWEKENTPYLDKLVFKGGTLLTKNYLEYHRISEDLDFTHSQSNRIKELTKSQKDRYVKKLIDSIGKELEYISKLSNLEFNYDTKNKKYVIPINSRSLYQFYLYYNNNDYIKFEISFVEDLIYHYKFEEVKNIVEFCNIDSKFLETINYNLKNVRIGIYPIEEIILEKIRATITREQFKPRDIFDLYLLHSQKDVFSIEEKYILRKLNSSPFEGVENNIKKFIEEEIEYEIDEIRELSLVEYNEEEFIEFSTQLIAYLKKILK